MQAPDRRATLIDLREQRSPRPGG